MAEQWYLVLLSIFQKMIGAPVSLVFYSITEHVVGANLFFVQESMGSFVRLILRLWYIINIYHDRGSLDVYLLPSSSCLGPCILSFGSGGTGPCGCGLCGCLGASVTWSSKLFFPFTKNVVLFLSGHDVCWCRSSIIYFFVVSRL